jgi:integrase/recombinase XerC
VIINCKSATLLRYLDAPPIPHATGQCVSDVRRRAVAAEIKMAIGNHSFRATGITAYLENAGTLERAATMAKHASTRTTQFYERRPDDVTLFPRFCANVDRPQI